VTTTIASESENGAVPYSGSFSAACCRELQPVVSYCEPLTTLEMGYHRLSRRVNKMKAQKKNHISLMEEIQNSK
jgi:hypothetical protein